MHSFSRLLCCALALGFLLAAGRAADHATDGKLHIVVFGAHPDDPQFKAGGTAIKWAKLGHHVKLVAVTNGDIGHWQSAGGPLAQRRKAEVEATGKLWGVETEVLDIHDGELLPSLENRKLITKIIREFHADLVIAHRPWDYHPDHRYVGVLVQDAAFMVVVPYFCPDVPFLKKNPVFMYSSDGFQKPYPFKPDVAVSLDDVMQQKLDGIHLMPSQVYEGGATGSEEFVKTVPPASDDAGRKAWLKSHWGKRQGAEADKYRDLLVKWYGPEKGKAVKNAESFELCEYGAHPDEKELRRLFPFFD